MLLFTFRSLVFLLSLGEGGRWFCLQLWFYPSSFSLHSFQSKTLFERRNGEEFFLFFVAVVFVHFPSGWMQFSAIYPLKHFTTTHTLAHIGAICVSWQLEALAKEKHFTRGTWTILLQRKLWAFGCIHTIGMTSRGHTGDGIKGGSFAPQPNPRSMDYGKVVKISTAKQGAAQWAALHHSQLRKT